MAKVIVTAALTGGIHGREANPNLPEQPDDIVREALGCREAGAAIVHVHVRDPRGKPSGDVAIFREVHDRVKAGSDVIVQLTTGGGVGIPIEERLKIAEVRPEMCSLNMSTVCFLVGGKEIFYQNFPSDIDAFARRMLDYGIKPELECYSIEAMDEIDRLIKQGLLTKPYYVNIVLGIPAQGALRASPRNLMAMVERLPAGSLFNVTAIAQWQLPLSTMSMILGGQVRVGMEDNVYYARGVPATSNVQLVERAVRIARELNLAVATPDEAREMLGLR
jgi:3-keto-5-aminohexanoate cleavage enzyme